MISPLTRRVLTVNILALGVLVAGLLYLGQYEDGLIDSDIDAMRTQAEIFAGALGQGAVGTESDGEQILLPRVARPMLRRLVEPTRARARLFGADGRLIADSRYLIGPGASVQEEALPPPERTGPITRFVVGVYDFLIRQLPSRKRVPTYTEHAHQRANDYEEAIRALNGESPARVRYDSRHRMVLITAVPVQRFKKVLGALMLTEDGSDIDAAVRDVRFGILKVFGVALCVTVILSFYLASTIARPVRRLAEAARRVRGGPDKETAIPDFTRRHDEIGDLSGALRDMTASIWTRMQAVESFAADVSHEIKNPLTSLRSAVETAARVADAEQQRQLMSIIQQDVRRLDRLISDISSASRLDAELARADMEEIDIGSLLKTLVEVHESTENGDGTSLELDVKSDSLLVKGIETRLVQVFQNLLSNAFSFSPKGGKVRLAVGRENGMLEISVDDEGPGIPEENLDSIFQRFYSQRPESEDFGNHSGLGLNISRQIIEAHGGTITATNRYDDKGAVAGAHFTVKLPAE